MAAAKSPVYLRVYDLSDGKASVWSPLLLWKKLEGIWHTGIQAFGFEYFYGGGVCKMYPQEVEQAFKMKPVEVMHLGYTSMTRAEFERFLDEIDQDFNRESYDLVKWNCNTFSNTCAKYLLDKGIPEKIIDLPEEVNATVMGSLIIKALKAMRGTPPVDADAATEGRIERVENASRNRGRFKTAIPTKSESPYAHSRRPRRYTCPSVRTCETHQTFGVSSSGGNTPGGHRRETSLMSPQAVKA